MSGPDAGPVDFLHTVDWVVPDPRGTAERLSAVLGLPPVRDEWVQRLPAHGYDAVFSRAGGRMVDAPTRLELIAPIPVEPVAGCSVAAPLELVPSWQGRRPQRTHATVLCVADLDAFVAAVRERGTPVWVEPGCRHLPHRRAWVGWLPSGPLHVPGYDGGLYLEVIPTEALGPALVAAVAEARRPAPVPVRVARRVHLVADLEGAVRTLARRVGLEPVAPRRVDAGLGATLARYEFRHAGGAALELAQPGPEGLARRQFATWGEGPLLTTFAVADREATLVRAVEQGAEVVADLGRSVLLGGPALDGLLVEVA